MVLYYCAREHGLLDAGMACLVWLVRRQKQRTGWGLKEHHSEKYEGKGQLASHRKCNTSQKKFLKKARKHTPNCSSNSDAESVRAEV